MGPVQGSGISEHSGIRKSCVFKEGVLVIAQHILANASTLRTPRILTCIVRLCINIGADAQCAHAHAFPATFQVVGEELPVGDGGERSGAGMVSGVLGKGKGNEGMTRSKRAEGVRGEGQDG